MTLRPYQRRALDDARAAYAAGARGVLLVAPTGAGKTIVAAAAIAAAVARGRRVIAIAPRREIVAQTSARLAAAGVRHGIIAAGMAQPDPAAPVQLGMAQTLRRRLPGTDPPDMLIIDEAHLDLHGEIASTWPSAWRLLLTATPLRSGGRSWRDLASALVEAATLPALVAAGHLVEPQIWSAATPDLAGLRRGAGGELAPGPAAARYGRPAIMGDTIDQWRRRCQGRPTLLFSSSIAHSRQLAVALDAAGARAAHIDGGTPAGERAAILARLAAGDLDVVCNYGVLCEGLDIPAVSAVIVARATQSEALWRQMVGRALRPAPGKIDAVIIDQGGCAHRHGHPMAPRAWSLDGAAPRAAAGDDVPACRTCAECMAIYAAPATACPRCGAERVAEPRRPPRALPRAELALLRPDGSAAPTVAGPDGRVRAPRPMPAGLAEAWRPAWEQLELRRLAAGWHWRWSWRALREAGAPLALPPAGPPGGRAGRKSARSRG